MNPNFPQRSEVLQVRVSFTDNAGYEESLTSGGTAAVVMGWL